MSYNEKMVEMQKKGKDLLKSYDKLFWDTMFFISELAHYPEKENFNIKQQLEWMKFMVNDEDMVTITRLAVALQYVNEPTDKEVIASLKENIQVSAMDARDKRRK